MAGDPGRVWDMLSDGWLYPVWVVGATHMRDVDDHWPRVGARVAPSGRCVADLAVRHDRSDRGGTGAPAPAARPRLAGRRGTHRAAVEPHTGGSMVRMSEAPARGPALTLDNPLQRKLLVARNRESLSRLAAIVGNRRIPEQPNRFAGAAAESGSAIDPALDGVEGAPPHAAGPPRARHRGPRRVPARPAVHAAARMRGGAGQDTARRSVSRRGRARAPAGRSAAGGCSRCRRRRAPPVRDAFSPSRSPGASTRRAWTLSQEARRALLDHRLDPLDVLGDWPRRARARRAAGGCRPRADSVPGADGRGRTWSSGPSDAGTAGAASSGGKVGRVAGQAVQIDAEVHGAGLARRPRPSTGSGRTAPSRSSSSARPTGTARMSSSSRGGRCRASIRCS